MKVTAPAKIRLESVCSLMACSVRTDNQHRIRQAKNR
jgi:hypothetical protein